jgi:hypothetical protein
VARLDAGGEFRVSVAATVGGRMGDAQKAPALPSPSFRRAGRALRGRQKACYTVPQMKARACLAKTGLSILACVLAAVEFLTTRLRTVSGVEYVRNHLH